MTTTIRQLLEQGHNELAASSESPRLDAEVLLGFLLGKGRAYLFAHPEDPVASETAGKFSQLLSRRSEHVPVAQLIGEWEFWSLPLQVTPDVLTPRPETECLVELALERVPDHAQARIADLGTGTGAIAIALACERPLAQITATDISEAALAVARQNATRHSQQRIELLQGEWLTPLAGRVFDLIISNPPYIAGTETGLTDPELEHEPQMALYSGPDGLDAIRTIIANASSHLADDGQLLLEHGFDQAEAVRQLLTSAGFTAIETHRDLGGQARVSCGTKPPGLARETGD